jgi:hypothetical protein
MNQELIRESALFLHLSKLLDKVVLDAHLADLVKLGLDPVDVRFLILQDRFEKFARAVVSRLDGKPDGIVVGHDGIAFGSLVVSVLIFDFRTDRDLPEFADNRNSFEKEDSGNELRVPRPYRNHLHLQLTKTEKNKRNPFVF